MNIRLESDRILLEHGAGHADVLPRFLDLPSKVVVALGDDATLGAGTYDYVEVAGRLTIPAVEVRITHLVVLPGGELDVTEGATIIGRDVPIDLVRDPFQWGNGLINFGTVRMSGPDKSPFVAMNEAAQGATILTLRSAPVGWQVGDEVCLPDTRQMISFGNDQAHPRREPNATITALSGATLTLSRPLAFSRNSVKRPDGSAVIYPRIANLTRPTVIKSENPNGTRWHVAHVGPGASFDVQGVAFVGTGRTRNEPLNSAAHHAEHDHIHAGTNQVGRYAAMHAHHVGSSLAVRRFAYNAIAAMDGGKWAVAVHQGHDIEILHNVCVDSPGGGFVTEDGNEVRNVFRGNFVAYAVGNGGDSAKNVANGAPGSESGYWFRGVGNVIDQNEAWNCQIGMNLFNQSWNAEGVPVATSKGSAETTVPNLDLMVPISMKDNVTVANREIGFDYWTVHPFPNERLIAAHSGAHQVGNGPSARSAADVLLVDPILIGQGGRSHGIQSSLGYTRGVEIRGGEIRGGDGGVYQGIGRVYGKVTGTIFQNARDFWFEQGGPGVVWKNAKFEPLPGHAPDYISAPALPPWSGPPAPLPGDGQAWMHMGDSPWIVENWQGTGKNYLLISPSSVRTALAWYSDDPNLSFSFPPPECGTTLGETWDRCGMAPGGTEPFTPGDAVELEGVRGLVAIELPRGPLPTPRAILTSNTRKTLAPSPEGEGVWLDFALTGDPTQADNVAYFSVDGGPRQTSRYRRGGFLEPFFVGWWSGPISNGAHTVRTWREQGGTEVPDSSMTFSVSVGEGMPPPPPPPTPIDCVLSEWGAWSAWTSINATTEQRTRTRTIVTPPSNGGAACGPLTDTETRLIVVTPPPTDTVEITAVVNGVMYRGTIPKVG